MKTVFADTVYWVALLTGSDPWAELAVRVTRQLGPVHLVTTEEVLSEFLTAMSRAGRSARRIAAERVLDLLHDEDVTVYPQSHESFLEGLDLYMRRLDKGYSLVDCISMNRMSNNGIREVLTNDHHFEQEGHVALMRK
jgi:predicted nucleic acid-binding protein